MFGPAGPAGPGSGPVFAQPITKRRRTIYDSPANSPAGPKTAGPKAAESKAESKAESAVKPVQVDCYSSAGAGFAYAAAMTVIFEAAMTNNAEQQAKAKVKAQGKAAARAAASVAAKKHFSAIAMASVAITVAAAKGQLKSAGHVNAWDAVNEHQAPIGGRPCKGSKGSKGGKGVSRCELGGDFKRGFERDFERGF
jgi:hypothetical protein